MKKYLILICVCLLFVFDSKAQVEITSAGTSTAYTLNVPGVFPLRNGVQVTFKAHTTCSASPTMNVSGTGALPIRKEGASFALAANDIKVGQIVTLAYDGTFWQMLSQLGTSAAIPSTYWDLNGTDIHNNNAGNVGIGITSPGVVGGSTKYLSVASTNDYTSDPVSLELIGSNTSDAAPVTKMDFIHASSGPLYDAIGSIQTFRNGTNKAGSLSFQTADGSGTVERMRIDNKGNVGIGTTSPATNLQLYGTSSTNMSIVSGSTQKSRVYLGSTVSPYLGAMEYDNSSNSLNFWTNNTSNRLVIDNGGKVGVGTASPGATFEVFQSTNPQMRLKTSAGSGVIFDYNSSAFSILNYDNTPIYFGTGGGSTRMNIQANGNVGIGTGVFTPSAKLHVIGGARITDLVGPGTVIADASGNLSVAAGSTITGSGAATQVAFWNGTSTLSGNSNFYWDNTNNRLGIGISSPGLALHIFGTNATTGFTTNGGAPEAGLRIHNNDLTNNNYSSIGFSTQLSNSGISEMGKIVVQNVNHTIGSVQGDMIFLTNGNGLTERMRITSGGNVGIGTTSPTNSLSFGNASNQKIWIENSSGATVGRALTISSGEAGAGFNNINGGDMIIQAGVGTGTGTSSILFQNGTTLGNSPTTQTMSTKMIILGNGNVGIGTTAPNSTLSVGASNQFQIDGNGNLIRINNVTYSWPAANGSGFLSNNGSGTLTWSAAGVLAGGTTNYVPKWSSANSLSSTSLIFDNGTTVGINTAAPSASSKLHVVGAGNGSTLNVDDNGLTNGSVLYLSSTSTAGTASNNSRMITIARSGANGSASHTAYGLQSTITNTGATSTNIAGFFSASGATNNYAVIVPSGGGNVGIGTSTPTHSLTVSSNTGGATLQSIKSYSASTFANSLAFQKGRGTETTPSAVLSGDGLGYIDFYGYNSGNGSMQLGASIFAEAAQGFSTANWAGSNLVFSTSPINSNGAIERMTVYNNGNVGIGTTAAPTSKLKVEGDVEIPATNDYTYTTAKTDYISLSSASFTTINALAVDGNATGNARWISSGTAGVADNMFATVNLPNGATITNIDVYVYDNDATYEVTANLVRNTLASNTNTTLATTAGTGTTAVPGVTVVSSTVSSVVNNALYMYYVKFNTRQNNANLWIRGAIITYTVTKVD